MQDVKNSQEVFNNYWQHYNRLNLPIHKIVLPTTKVENYLGWEVDTEKMEIGMTEQRKVYLREKLSRLLMLAKCTRGQFESIVGIISFCRGGIHCLQGPLQALYAKQTVMRRITKSKWQVVNLGEADKFVCQWLLYLLEKWKCSVFGSVRGISGSFVLSQIRNLCKLRADRKIFI